MSDLNIDAVNSQMHLDAMLYLLEDPTLDSVAFEARLENDPHLAEIQASSVASYQMLRSVSSWDVSVPIEKARAADIATGSPSRSWRLLATLAASLLLTAMGAWQVFYLFRPITSNIASGTSEAQNRIVLAWSDIQSDLDGSNLAREIADREIENETTLALLELTDDADIPDWIVLATSDVIDGGFESRDGKVMTQ